MKWAVNTVRGLDAPAVSSWRGCIFGPGDEQGCVATTSLGAVYRTAAGGGARGATQSYAWPQANRKVPPPPQTASRPSATARSRAPAAEISVRVGRFFSPKRIVYAIVHPSIAEGCSEQVTAGHRVVGPPSPPVDRQGRTHVIVEYRATIRWPSLFSPRGLGATTPAHPNRRTPAGAISQGRGRERYLAFAGCSRGARLGQLAVGG